MTLCLTCGAYSSANARCSACRGEAAEPTPLASGALAGQGCVLGPKRTHGLTEAPSSRPAASERYIRHGDTVRIRSTGERGEVLEVIRTERGTWLNVGLMRSGECETRAVREGEVERC